MYRMFLLIFTFSCILLMADSQQDAQVEQRRLQRQREDSDRLKQQVEQARLQRQREDAGRLELEQEQEKKRVKSQIEENSERPYHYEDEELYRQEILEDEPFNR